MPISRRRGKERISKAQKISGTSGGAGSGKRVGPMEADNYSINDLISVFN